MVQHFAVIGSRGAAVDVTSVPKVWKDHVYGMGTCSLAICHMIAIISVVAEASRLDDVNIISTHFLRY